MLARIEACAEEIVASQSIITDEDVKSAVIVTKSKLDEAKSGRVAAAGRHGGNQAMMIYGTNRALLEK